MKILVTGGAGFIGSNLVRTLVKADHEVIALDNFSLGTEKNLHDIKDNLRTVKGNILDLDLLINLTKNVDIIFNQAAASSSPMFKKNLKEALSVNIDGFVNILTAAKENNIKRVIYASTSSVYGNSNPPLREDMKLDPVNFYASSKLMNEHLAALYSIEYGIETVGFRYMSIYGPNEESKGIFANLVTQFLWAMKKNEQPVIYGDGSQSRDFTYVKDVVEANILAMESKKKLCEEILNIGTGISTNLNVLVSTLNKVLDKNIKPKYIKNTVKNYIATQQADISKIRNVLGFKPKFSLEEGIRDILVS